jgi:uncharacterized protein YqjF (DUF2071 family)
MNNTATPEYNTFLDTLNTATTAANTTLQKRIDEETAKNAPVLGELPDVVDYYSALTARSVLYAYMIKCEAVQKNARELVMRTQHNDIMVAHGFQRTQDEKSWQFGQGYHVK